MTENEKSSESQDLDLSIVVAIIEGGQAAVGACLGSLEKGMDGVRLECIVPYDARIRGVRELASKFPWVEFVDARDQIDADKYGAVSREHHDVLRSIGLKRASAPVVALLEDHGTPSEGWIRAVLKAHRDSDVGAIGGAVENGIDRLLNWAVYYCDFGRYQNPVDSDNVEYLSDSNVSYKRDALWNVKDQWSEAFQETLVNWQIKANGEALVLNPEMVVFQTRRVLKLIPAFWERFVWGRSFAGTRARDFPAIKRIVFAFMSFLLPFVLTVRIVVRGFQKKRFLSRLILATPLIFVLETIWSAGEFAGYLTGQAASTDNA